MPFGGIHCFAFFQAKTTDSHRKLLLVAPNKEDKNIAHDPCVLSLYILIRLIMVFKIDNSTVNLMSEESAPLIKHRLWL